VSGIPFLENAPSAQVVKVVSASLLDRNEGMLVHWTIDSVINLLAAIDASQEKTPWELTICYPSVKVGKLENFLGLIFTNFREGVRVNLRCFESTADVAADQKSIDHARLNKVLRYKK